MLGTADRGSEGLSAGARAQGHTDWVFGISWVTESHLVTVSRDQHVKLWHVDAHAPSPRPNLAPLHSQLPIKVCAQLLLRWLAECNNELHSDYRLSMDAWFSGTSSRSCM